MPSAFLNTLVHGVVTREGDTTDSLNYRAVDCIQREGEGMRIYLNLGKPPTVARRKQSAAMSGIKRAGKVRKLNRLEVKAMQQKLNLN